jgi:hypothetical protein
MSNRFARAGSDWGLGGTFGRASFGRKPRLLALFLLLLSQPDARATAVFVDEFYAGGF